MPSFWTKGLAPLVGIIGVIAYQDVCYATHVPWNHNWDNLAYVSRRPPSRLQPCNLGGSTRHIFLVRNGQGFTDLDDEFGLTWLGKEQARIVANRLLELDLPYLSITYSCMAKRSIETADLMSKIIPKARMIPCNDIHKGIPIEPLPKTSRCSQSPEKFYQDGVRLEEAFHKYFYRPGRYQTMDSYEIIVCPANVIRYFVCRAMQFPPEAWERFTLFNCSITWLGIGDDGSVTLYTFSDFGHLPVEKLTPGN